jgi:hypothetical protein
MQLALDALRKSSTESFIYTPEMSFFKTWAIGTKARIAEVFKDAEHELTILTWGDLFQ